MGAPPVTVSLRVGTSTHEGRPGNMIGNGSRKLRSGARRSEEIRVTTGSRSARELRERLRERKGEVPKKGDFFPALRGRDTKGNGLERSSEGGGRTRP